MPAVDGPYLAGQHDDCNGECVRVSVVDTGWWPRPRRRTARWTGTGDVENRSTRPGRSGLTAATAPSAAGVVRAVAPKSTCRSRASCRRLARRSNPRSSGSSTTRWPSPRRDQPAGRHDHPPACALLASRCSTSSGWLTCPALSCCARPAITDDGAVLAGRLRMGAAVGGLDKTSTAKASWSNYDLGRRLRPRRRHRERVVDGTFVTQEPQTPRGEVRFFPGVWREWSGTSFSTPWVAGVIAARASATGESGRMLRRAVFRQARDTPERCRPRGAAMDGLP